jgi:hypothetical protein
MQREGDRRDDQAEGEHGRNLDKGHKRPPARQWANPLHDPRQKLRRRPSDRIERVVDVASQLVFVTHAWASAIG